jgi:hypothetical protein
MAPARRGLPARHGCVDAAVFSSARFEAALWLLRVLVLPSILPLLAIGTALDCFHARQARRILSLVAAAATAGAS